MDPLLTDFEDIWALATHRRRGIGSGVVVAPPSRAVQGCIAAERHRLIVMNARTRECLFTFWTERLLDDLTTMDVQGTFVQASSRYSLRKRRASITLHNESQAAKYE